MCFGIKQNYFHTSKTLIFENFALRETEHLILIGDHQQLRPSCADYGLAKDKGLKISLFERMMKAKVEVQSFAESRKVLRHPLFFLIIPSSN